MTNEKAIYEARLADAFAEELKTLIGDFIYDRYSYVDEAWLQKNMRVLVGLALDRPADFEDVL